MIKKILSSIMIFLCFIVTAYASNSLNVDCPIDKQYVCSYDSCNPIKPSVTIKIRIADSHAEYSRCDKQGCDNYEAQVTRSGIFTYLSPIEKNATIKLDQDMSFVEINSLLLNVYVAYGKCRQINMELD